MERTDLRKRVVRERERSGERKTYRSERERSGEAVSVGAGGCRRRGRANRVGGEVGRLASEGEVGRLASS